MKVLLCAAISLNAALSGVASAGAQCDEPVAEWQPREALQAKLEADGWRVRSIRSADGCYKAEAVDAQGKAVQAYFNPKTFEPVATVVDAQHT